MSGPMSRGGRLTTDRQNYWADLSDDDEDTVADVDVEGGGAVGERRPADVGDSEEDSDEESEADDEGAAERRRVRFVDLALASDEYGGTIDDLFLPSWKDKWMAIPLNSTWVMTKGALSNGEFFFEFDARLPDSATEALVSMIASTSVNVEIHTYDGTFSNFDEADKVTYTSKMEACQSDYADEVFAKVKAVLARSAHPPRIVRRSSYLTKHLDCVHSWSSEVSVIRTNFIPLVEDLKILASKGAVAMIPGGKIMANMDLPDKLFFNKGTVVDDKRMTWPNGASLAFGQTTYLYQYSFEDADAVVLYKQATDEVDPFPLMRLFRKRTAKTIEVTDADRSAISSIITEYTGEGMHIALTRQWVQKYQMVRSNVMELALAETLDISRPTATGFSPWTGEMPISQLYPELSKVAPLTPDLILCERTSADFPVSVAKLSLLVDEDLDLDGIYFVEVKVTDSLGIVNSNEAVSKYSAYCTEINKVFSRLKRKERARCFVVVFSMSMAAEMEDRFSTAKLVGSKVYNTYRSIQQHWKAQLFANPIYRNLKAAADRGEDEFFDPLTMDKLFGTYFTRNPDSMLKAGSASDMMKLSESRVGSDVLSFSMKEADVEARLEEYSRALLLSLRDEFNSEMAEVTSRWTMGGDLTEQVEARKRVLETRVTITPDYIPISEMKAFKVPFLHDFEGSANISSFASELGVTSSAVTQDGTLVVHKSKLTRAGLMTDFWLPMNKMTDSQYKAMKTGFVYDEDVAIEMETLMKELACAKSNSSKLSAMVDESFEDLTWSANAKQRVKSFVMSRQFENLMHLQMIMQELVQIEGRRGMLHTERHSFSTSVYNVFRAVGPYILEVKHGPKLNRKHNLRFRIWRRAAEGSDFIVEGFHSFYKVENSDWSATKFLSLQPIDLVTYMTIFESAMMLTVGFVEKYMEAFEGTTPTAEAFHSLSVRLFQLLEHRNNTSVASQLSRYLLVGNTSLHADRLALVDEIGSDVIRSKFQIFTIYRQLSWTKAMSKLRTHFIAESLEGQRNNTPDMFSRIPSFYSGSTFTLSLLLDEIYFCNLLDPNYGSRKHMTEATFKKMAKMEMLWRTKIRTAEDVQRMRGLVKAEGWIESEETLFFFDRTMVYATMSDLLKSVSLPQLLREFLPKVFEPLSELMTLKSSVSRTRGRTIYDPGTSFTEERSTSYETQKELVDQFRVRTVLDVCNLFNRFDYYFAEFPKPQIGGPREILIQDMFTRGKARLLENFFCTINRQFENEMTSNADRKFTRQANMDFLLEQEMSYQKKQPVSLTMANNKDHSKWSPGANVIQYCYMITPLDVGKSLKEFLLCAILAYGSSLVGMPREMKETALSLGAEKLKLSKESDIIWVYEEFANEDGGKETIRFKSGWPQGMLQFTSSTYHVVEKHLMKIVWAALARSMDVSWVMYDMITSDDTTDYISVSAKSWARMVVFLCAMLTTGYMIGKTFNMFENKKKTNLHLVIKEFNSIFQIGKTVKTAMVKFLVKAVSVPDFTYPEEAVKEMISQELMLLTNGATYNVIRSCRSSHRRLLRVAYNQDSYSAELSEKLQCDVDDLPVELGFLPKTNVIESCIYGSAIYNYTKKEGRLDEFMKKLYSNRKGNMNFFSVDKTSYMADMAFKEKLKLPMKLDKKMQEMRARIGVTNASADEIAMTRFDVMMDGSDSVFFHTYAAYKLMSINVRFSIDTGYLYRAHSMVRANQISSGLSLLSQRPGTTIRTVSDFVDMILANDDFLPEAVEKHPMRPVFELALKVSEDLSTKLANNDIGVHDAVKRPKFRLVSFCNKEMYPIMSTNESYRIYRKLLSERSKREKYKADTLSTYYKLSETFDESSLISTLRLKDNLNAMTIAAIFENMASMMRAFTITMPFEEPSSANAAENLLTLLRNRMFAHQVVAPFEVKGEDIPHMLLVSEVCESAASLGLLLDNISQMPNLCSCLAHDNLVRPVVTVNRDFTNKERMAVFLNDILAAPTEEMTLERVLVTMPTSTFYSKTFLPRTSQLGDGVIMKTWISLEWQVVMLYSRTNYYIGFSDLADTTAGVECLDEIVSREFRFIRGKAPFNYRHQMRGVPMEVHGVTVNAKSTKLISTEAALTLSKGLEFGMWAVKTGQLAALFLGGSASVDYKVFSAPIPSSIPNLSDAAISLVQDAVVKSKLKVMSGSNTEISTMTTREMRTLAQTWLTDEEESYLRSVFCGGETDEDETDRLFLMMGALSISNTAATSFFLSEVSDLGETAPTEANVEEHFTEMEFALQSEDSTSLVALLVEDGVLDQFYLEAEPASREEQVTEANDEAIGVRTTESFVRMVRRFIARDLDLPFMVVRGTYRTVVQNHIRRKKPVPHGQLHFDLLNSLYNRVVEYAEDQGLQLSDAAEIFLLCAKVFLSYLFEDCSVFEISNSGRSLIVF